MKCEAYSGFIGLPDEPQYLTVQVAFFKKPDIMYPPAAVFYAFIHRLIFMRLRQGKVHIQRRFHRLDDKKGLAGYKYHAGLCRAEGYVRPLSHHFYQPVEDLNNLVCLS